MEKEKTRFKIVREEIVQEKSGWYEKVVTYTPYSFIDGQDQKHFIIRLVSGTGRKFEDKAKRKELATLLHQLRKNNGDYITFYSRFKDLSDFFDWVRKENHTLEVFVFENPSHVDFHGNIVEYSSAFFYRIYTREMLRNVISQLRTVKRNQYKKNSNK